jgi:hypothetical protein
MEVASTERTFNGRQNQRLKNAPKNVAPKVAPRFVCLVRTFCNVPKRWRVVRVRQLPRGIRLALFRFAYRPFNACD